MNKILSLVFVIVLLLLCGTAMATDLVWDAPTTGGIPTGYRVYYGTKSGTYLSAVDVGNTTRKNVAELPLLPGNSYYIIVRAYNEAGESGDSNEVNWDEPGLQMPPGGVTIRIEFTPQ